MKRGSMQRLLLKRALAQKLGWTALAILATWGQVALAAGLTSGKQPPLPPVRPFEYAALETDIDTSGAEAQDQASLALAESAPPLKHPPFPPKRPAEYCLATEGMVESPLDAAPLASYASTKVDRAPISPYDDLIADYAERHGVPESFIHRIVMRESRYNPKAMHNHCFGLLQVKYATAKNMGYKGTPEGLLDPKVNLTYGTPYIANAYMLSGGDERRAISLYSAGYYYTAKRQNKLMELRTASSKPLAPGVEAAPPPPPPAPTNPLAQLFQAFAGNSSASPMVQH
jgi:soluble lytic murein transglycosylase-like protein